MIRRSILFSAFVAAVLVAQMGSVSGAGTSITGTVKVTGLATSADVVVYIQ